MEEGYYLNRMRGGHPILFEIRYDGVGILHIFGSENPTPKYAALITNSAAKALNQKDPGFTDKSNNQKKTPLDTGRGTASLGIVIKCRITNHAYASSTSSQAHQDVRTRPHVRGPERQALDRRTCK